eukprot:scaffold96075_cov31-Tisochrysis_lutea.AAC.12
MDFPALLQIRFGRVARNRDHLHFTLSHLQEPQGGRHVRIHVEDTAWDRQYGRAACAGYDCAVRCTA